MMTSWRALGLTVLTITLLLAGPAKSLWAYQAAEMETAAVETDSAAAEEFTPDQERDYTINSLIMFLCAVLVLLMQAGFAMLEVGLNSQKNAVNILFKNLMDLAMGVLLYLFVGYALMYPGSDYAGKWYGYAGAPFVTRDAQESAGGAGRLRRRPRDGATRPTSCSRSPSPPRPPPSSPVAWPAA